MSQHKRGRPIKNINNVAVSNFIVEFFSKKKNEYNADICYMKVVDKDVKNKMKPITVLAEEGMLMPYWQTDKQDTILKVKDKWIGSIEPVEQGKVYSIDAEFESFCIEKENQEPVKGYCIKVPQMRPFIEINDSD